MHNINAGDTAFVLISAALVLLMTPGLAFFYGGLVRHRNVLTVMLQSYISMGIVTALWVICGFSLAYGHDHWGIIGDLGYFGLRGVGEAPSPIYAITIPFLGFFLFQVMFAIITPALITGAFADRVSFRVYLIFLVLWSFLIYIPFRSLDLGRRLSGADGRGRLCRWHGGASERWHGGAGLRVRYRQPEDSARG